jgi:hypothetical protein
VTSFSSFSSASVALCSGADRAQRNREKRTGRDAGQLRPNVHKPIATWYFFCTSSGETYFSSSAFLEPSKLVKSTRGWPIERF